MQALTELASPLTRMRSKLKSSAASPPAIIGAWPPSHRQRTRWRVTGAVPAEPTWSGRRVACPAAGRHQQPPRHGGWRSEKLSRLGRLSISVCQVPRWRPMYSIHRVVRPYQHPPGLSQQWKRRANVPRRINPLMRSVSANRSTCRFGISVRSLRKCRSIPVASRPGAVADALARGMRGTADNTLWRAPPSVTICRRPSFDDVQNLSGACKFFPAHEFMRQAPYPLEIGGNYPLRLGCCPAQLDINSLSNRFQLRPPFRLQG
jgi:hypothetical protein